MKLQRYDIACFQDDITPHHSGEWVKWNDVAKLEASHTELLSALKELYYTVQGEVPSLLDEDSGGNGYLDVEISDAIAKAEGKVMP